jgi:hypothetical protein
LPGLHLQPQLPLLLLLVRLQHQSLRSPQSRTTYGAAFAPSLPIFQILKQQPPTAIRSEGVHINKACLPSTPTPSKDKDFELPFNTEPNQMKQKQSPTPTTQVVSLRACAIFTSLNERRRRKKKRRPIVFQSSPLHRKFSIFRPWKCVL